MRLDNKEVTQFEVAGIDAIHILSEFLNQKVDKKPRDPCAVVSANCCPKGARRDDRFEEKLGLEAPIAAILALFSHKRVARATSRGSGEASRVGNDVGASLSGFGRLDPCWLRLSRPSTARDAFSPTERRILLW